MGEIKWSDEQKAAIETRNCNLLVAAAAGAGKTAVLVERIIRMITNEEQAVDIDRLLIVTFTNAAATEMRERIASALTGALEKNPNSPRLHKQLTLLNKASITTIHSFCLEVIRNNFPKLDIDPGFRIADQTEADLLKLEVLQELFEDMYEEATETTSNIFYELLECYSGNRDDQDLQNMVLSLYDFIQSNPQPEKWLNNMIALFQPAAWVDFSETIWGEELIKKAELELQGLRDLMEKALAVIANEPGLEKYYPVFSDEANRLDALLNICSIKAPKWDSIYQAVQNFSFENLPRASKECTPERKDYVKEIRDTVKAGIAELAEKVFTADSEQAKQDLKTLYPLLMCLAELVIKFTEKYQSKKKEKALVDFNDLEHFCLQILADQDEKGELKPSQVALDYRERFQEILVDEYQDSNDVQETIIQMISRADVGEPNVFMVGDVKQSIYRFRQANPELFQEKYDEYLQFIPGEDTFANCLVKILLYKNYRSRQEVIAAVNYLFRQIMSRNAGELDYTEKEALNFGANFPDPENSTVLTGGEVELHILETKNDGLSANTNNASSNGVDNTNGTLLEENGLQTDTEKEPELLDNIQAEARLVANRIRHLFQQDEEGKVFKVFDKSSKVYRPLEYRDIVVLLRTTRHWADVFVEEFSKQGIPVFADTGTGFFKTVEVQVILSLLQVIDNPLQDIPLLAVLRSPFVAFTTDELAELRLVRKNTPLFEALKTLAASSESQAALKARNFLANLQRWRDLALYLSTDKLLWQLYKETGYYGMVAAMPAGQQRQANLRILYERARQFEETSFKGLFNFIYFIDKLKSGQGDMGSAKMLGEKDNVVRIMSVHKSKGLEFPVVILAGCGKKFNLQDMNKNILLHHKLGFGPEVVNYRLRMAYPSLAKLAIRERIRMETLSEEMRILYVALTRAKEKLILTGAVADIAKACPKWAKVADGNQEKLPVYQVLKANNYLDWIGPAVIRHRTVRESAELKHFLPAGLVIADPSQWMLQVHSKQQLLSEDSLPESNQSAVLEVGELDPSLYSEIEKRLNWQYPLAGVSKLPAKVTVTELKRRFDLRPEGIEEIPEYILPLVKKPLFLQEKKGLNAAEIGTVIHFVMQHLDFCNPNLEIQIQQMVEKDLLTEQQAEYVNLEKIRVFVNSSLGKRIRAAVRVQREVPFNMEITCQEVFPDKQELSCPEEELEEKLLLQGIIDCYFEEEDGLVLIDYKTDYVAEGAEANLKEKYKTQIAYYTRALEKLTGKPVKEKYIYLFHNGKILDF